MSDHTSESATQDTVTPAAGNSAQTQEQGRVYTQEEFDRHMAGMKNSLQKKYDRMYSDLGDVEELRQLKTQAEQQKLEEATKRGEFDSVIRDLAAKKDAEIARRDQIIHEYRVHTPLLSAAAQHRAVAPEQVRALLSDRVRLGDSGDVEVVDERGQVRYTDAGEPMAVPDLVREFLDSNPHFVQSTPVTTNTRSSVSGTKADTLDISRLDMSNPDHRRRYSEARRKGLIR
jgi:hypothetical protein